MPIHSGLRLAASSRWDGAGRRAGANFHQCGGRADCDPPKSPSSLAICSLGLDLVAKMHLNSSTRVMAKYWLNVVQPGVVGPTASSRANHAEVRWE
jgi:hypothetical protein